MVSPADGEARDPHPASGLSASSKLRREDQDEGRESAISVVCPLLNRRISARPRRLSQSNSYCGAEPRPCLWGVA